MLISYINIVFHYEGLTYVIVVQLWFSWILDILTFNFFFFIIWIFFLLLLVHNKIYIFFVLEKWCSFGVLVWYLKWIVDKLVLSSELSTFIAMDMCAHYFFSFLNPEYQKICFYLLDFLLFRQTHQEMTKDPFVDYS